MRASEGNGRVRTWRKLAGIAAAAALALSVIGGGTANAATPAGWVAGYGTDSSPTAPQPISGASSTAVSAGNKVGFFEWLRNDGPSNISQLFVNEITSASVAGSQWSIRDNSLGTTIRAGSCPVATPLVCSFGALNNGQTVYLVVAFTVPSNIADGHPFGVQFDWNTTGVPPGKNNSHGDALIKGDSVIVTNNGDAAGNFNLGDTAGLTVFDNQKLNGQNRQATLANVVDVQVGVAVGDGPSATLPFPCQNDVPTGFLCSSLTSQVSLVEVGNGKTFANTNGAGTPGIKVIVSFAQTPNQLGGSNPFVYHAWVDSAGGQHVELITATCHYAGGFPDNQGPCLDVGNKIVTVWLTHNGGIRM